MGNLFTVLGVLFVVLAIVVWATERWGSEPSPEQAQTMRRWVPIMIIATLILALVRQCTG